MNGSGRPVGVHGATEVAFYIDDTHSMSERVQSLADAVYKEFERLIKAYDENVVKDLMPLVVAILEGLESSCREKQQADVDAELLRDDNDQLLAQYEKERQLRRIADQKYLALEDSMEEERKQLQGRLESFESIVRMFEIKLKNSQDQVVRMDEKEQETKKEFSKLHERYTDLLKAHMDFKERVKTLVSGNPASQEVIDQSNLSSDLTLPRNFKFPNLASKQNRSEFSDVESSSEMSSPVKSRTIVYTKDDDDDDDDGDDNDGEHGYANKSIGFEINNAINSEEDQSTGPKRLISIDEHLRKSLIGEMDKLHLTFCEEDGNYESLMRPGVYDDMENDERSELALGDPSKAEEEQDLRQEDDDDDEGGDDNDYSDADQYNFYGVSKEIENLIMENNELLETKHALNIVKDDLIAKVDELTGEKEILKDELNSAVQSKERIKSRVAELEEELKRMREELDKERNKDSGSNHGDGEEDGLPPGQRKRFTRLEMARVLMERNQYKERLMELQEAVRWAEMVRAARDHPEFGGEKKKSSIWNFFSNLFSTGRSNSSFADHSTPGDHSSFLTPNSDQRSIGLNSILDRRRRTEERSMATPTGPSKLHPPQEESRLVACGWSLPPKFQLNRTLNFDSGSSSSLPNSVPLPIFCKPLLEEDPNIKILCAAAITWKGGRTKDGGNVVGTSVFYPNHADPLGATQAGRHGDDEIEKLNEEILSREKEIKDVNDFPMGCGGNDPDPYHVWVCVDDRTGSHVIVVDAGNEGEVLEKFHVCLPNLHCITGVPGATEDCYTNKDNSSSSSSSSSSPQTSLPGHVTFVQLHDSDDLGVGVTGDPQGSRPLVDPAEEEVERSLNLQPTVWMGNIAGSLYVYSADPGSRKRLHVVKLGDSIMNICHLRGRVFVALANGTVACFSRASDGQWNVRSHYIIELAQPTYAVRSAAVVAKKFLWCSVANDIFVIDPVTFVIGDKFNAHPRKENHVRHMAWMGEGVWVGFRNDSSLRLYHAYTHQYLQDVDIEPCVSKFLGSSKLGFSLVQISCLMTSQDRLWIGTGNGVVINIPISECTNPSSVSTPVSIGGHKAPGGVVRVYGDKKNEEIYPGSFIPYCSLSQVQLSFHGLKEVVKFIIAMPGNEKKIPTTKIGEKHAEIYRKYSLPLPSSTSLTLSQSQSSTAIGELTPEPAGRAKCLWIMCGGEGCSDFRSGEDMSSAVDRDDIEHSDSTGDMRMEDVGVIDLLPKSDKSHIIMWQLLVP